MKKLYSKLIILALLIGLSFQSYANNSDDVEILSKIVEIEKIQEILTSEASIIITNGLISDKIQVYIDDSLISLKSTSSPDDFGTINVEKFKHDGSSAKILMINENVKIKVRLIKENEVWTVKSCYVKSGGSIYASVNW
ncbi:MAG: hypothetical protein AAFQ94_19915 [Bacteroidota bacterium]